MRQISDKQVAKLSSLLVGLQQLLDSLESQAYVLSDKASQRIAELTAESKCLYCALPLDGEVRRGCHQVCYNTLKTRIAKNEITERHAVEDEGWMTAANAKPGRKSARPDPMREIGHANHILRVAAAIEGVPAPTSDEGRAIKRDKPSKRRNRDSGRDKKTRK